MPQLMIAECRGGLQSGLFFRWVAGAFGHDLPIWPESFLTRNGQQRIVDSMIPVSLVLLVLIVLSFVPALAFLAYVLPLPAVLLIVMQFLASRKGSRQPPLVIPPPPMEDQSAAAVRSLPAQEAADLEPVEGSAVWAKAGADTAVCQSATLALAISQEFIPMARQLTNLVAASTEASTLQVTESIFSIADVSKTLAGRIEGVLRTLADGDDSLKQDAAKLKQAVVDLAGLGHKVTELGQQYNAGMEAIHQDVFNIDKHTQGILDLAEQTHVLSINASIEAARTGRAGAGFAVIANEVQKLAQKSREMAEIITRTTRKTVTTVNTSHTRQSEFLKAIMDSLAVKQAEFESMAGRVYGSVATIEDSVQQTGAQSAVVNSALDDIIHSLQFQDSTRQILEHLATLHEWCATQLKPSFSLLGVAEVQTAQRTEAVNRLHEVATTIFSVPEEWEALGMSHAGKVGYRKLN